MGEIDALISLLQDDSPTVLDAVRRRLLELRGMSRQPLVVAAGSNDVGVRERAREILAEMERFTDLRFVKVAAHAGVPGNERADRLARDAIRTGGQD